MAEKVQEFADNMRKSLQKFSGKKNIGVEFPIHELRCDAEELLGLRWHGVEFIKATQPQDSKCVLTM